MSNKEMDDILDGIPAEILDSDKVATATKTAVEVAMKSKKEKKVVRAEKREKKSCAFTLPEQCFALLLEDKWRDARKIALKWKREMETYKSQYEKWITK